MTPDDWMLMSRLLRRLQWSVGFIAVIVTVFFGLAVLGGMEQKSRDVAKLKRDQEAADKQVDAIMKAIAEVREKAEESRKDQAYIHGSQDEIREMLRRLEGRK